MGSAPSNNVKANFKNGSIQITTDKTIYHPGSQVSGKIYLRTYSNRPPSTLSINFNGVEAYGRVKRRPKGGSYFSTTRRKIINFTKSLYKWESQVAQGDYEVSFSFILPEDLPASFHKDGVTFLAHITYNMCIKLQANEKPKKADTIVDVQKLFIRKPIVEKPSTSYTETRTFNVRSLCCIPRGSRTYKATFNQTVFAQRDKAELILEIDNSQSKLINDHINFQLYRKITLGSWYILDTIVQHHIEVNVPAGALPQTQVFAFHVPFKFKDFNHSLDTRDHAWPQGSADYGLGDLCQPTQGKLIKSEYFLEVLGGSKSFCSPDTGNTCNVTGFIFPDPPPKNLCLPVEWYPQVLPNVEIFFLSHKGEELHQRIYP